jgi:HSP20 family molecular chaperone IbpA
MPVASSSWNIGPSYYSTPLSVRLVETSPVERVLKKQRIIAQRMFDATAYPTNRYQLVNNDKQFQLTVDVPGVKEGDIDIKLDDGQLTVQGKRVSASDSSRFTSQFSQSFYLDPTVDVDNFKATLKNGVLVVSAPKDLAKLEENVRRIPITPLEDIIAEDNEKDDDLSIEIEAAEGANNDVGIDTEAPEDADDN